MFSRIKLGKRLAIGFGAVLFLLTLVGFYATREMYRLADTNKMMYEHPFTVSNVVLRVDGDIVRIHRAMKDVALAEDTADIESARQVVDVLENKIISDFKIISARFLGDKALYQSAEKLFRDWKPIRDEVIELMRTGRKSQAADITKNKGASHVEKIIGAMEALNNFAQGKAIEFFDDTQESFQRGFSLTISFLIVAMVIGVLVTVFITLSVVRPIKEIVEVSDAIAGGDLTHQITYQATDEMGQMADSLRSMLKGVIGEGQSIKNGVPIPLWTVDRNLHLTFLNSASSRLLKTAPDKNPEQFLDEKLADVIKDKEGRVTSMVSESLESGQRVEEEIEFGSDIKPLYFRQVTSPLLDLDGAIIGAMGVGVDITEQKLVEEALRVSRDYLEKLTNSMWDVVFSVKMPERVIEWVNDSSRLMGYEPSECVGKDTAFFYSDKDDFLDFGHKLNNATAAGKDVFHSEQLLKRKSGETFPAEITVTFHKKNDEVVTVTSIVRDITERKLAEEALKKAHDELEQRVEERTAELTVANELLMDEISERKKSETALKRYEVLLERTQQISKVGGWEIDVETGTPSFTSEVFRIYEIDTADVPPVEEGMNYYVPEHRPVIAEAVDRAISQGEPYDLELRLITAKNNRRWVRTIGIPRQEDGKTVIVSGVIQDITERKRIEGALRESEERYRTVVQDQTAVISRFLKDGTLTFVNEVYCRFFQKSSEELIGKQWRPVAVPEDLPVFEEKLATMSVENPIVLIENRVVSGSGEIRWMQFVNRGFFDEERQLVEIQSVGHDITELKLAEEALKRSELTLRQVSSRRLDAFEDERKRIGLELHDGLAQTMSAIKIWAKSAAQKHIDKNNESKVAESLENVVSLSQRAIEELRRVSKNLHPAVLENLGILAAIDWLCEEIEPLDRNINITRQIDIIENEVPDSLKTVIFRVTQEALNNVFRHSKANLVRISLQKAEREIKLIIEDDGSGFEIGPQNLYKKTGHGLGLISMEERTKLAGGNFSIESQLLEGTMIKAVWPL